MKITKPARPYCRKNHWCLEYFPQLLLTACLFGIFSLALQAGTAVKENSENLSIQLTGRIYILLCCGVLSEINLVYHDEIF